MNTDAFLGDRLREKYANIYPLIRLILWRAEFCTTLSEAIGNLFAYDSGKMADPKDIRSKVGFLTGIVPYYLARTRNIHKNKLPCERTVLVSDTILNSPRYHTFQTVLKSMDCAVGVATIYNHRLSRNAKQGYHRNVILGGSIVGKDVRKHVIKIFMLLRSILIRNETCDQNFCCVDNAMTLLEVVVRKRIEIIKSELLRNRVQLYLTCNQNRVEELLLIMASAELGIKTKEWQHYGLSQLHIPEGGIHENVPIFTNELLMWSEADVKWLKLYRTLENAVYSETKISIGGCLELSRREVLEALKCYSREHAVVFFVMDDPGNLDLTWHNNLPIWKKQVFDALNELQKKQGVKVYIRYHPDDDCKKYPDDLKLCEDYGFVVLDDSYESFIKAVCTCKAAFGYGSTAIFVAHSYGCRGYCIKFNETTQFDFCGNGIEELSYDKIPSAVVEAHEISDEDYMNIEQVFSV